MGRSRRAWFWPVAIGGTLLAAAIAITQWSDAGGSGGYGGGGAGGGAEAAQALAEAHAARIATARLRQQVDELDLRLGVVEAASGYRALDGTVLPPVSDPLAPRARHPRP